MCQDRGVRFTVPDSRFMVEGPELNGIETHVRSYGLDRCRPNMVSTAVSPTWYGPQPVKWTFSNSQTYEDEN
jgi:hypothetical protein